MKIFDESWVGCFASAPSDEIERHRHESQSMEPLLKVPFAIHYELAPKLMQSRCFVLFRFCVTDKRYRDGSSSFILLAVVRNAKRNHLA